MRCEDPEYNRFGDRIVRFSVTLDEPWEGVGVFFKAHPDAMDQLLEHVAPDDGFQFETMTVKGLLEASRGDIPVELDEQYRSGTVGRYASMVLALRQGMGQFIKFLENTVPPETIEGKKMTKGVLSANIEEAVLMTLRKAYTLQSLEAAQKLTVYEYEIARKEVYNEAMVAYNKAMAIDAANSRRR